MPYRYPAEDTRFILQYLIGFDALAQASKTTDLDSAFASAIIDEAARLGEEVFAPLNRAGDEQHARMTPDGVQQPEGFAEAYQKMASAGWLSLSAEEQYGGQRLPQVLSCAVSEIWNAANMALALCPLLTESAIEAISAHADEYLKAIVLPKLTAGVWTGTMNLTEPQAGTDLAAITTKAEADGAHYALSGQKIFITWGAHTMTENIIHLVLARLPDAPPGIKGISLFLVPQVDFDEDGALTESNRLKCISIEDKLGVRASPTCVMQYERAKGYLVGEPHQGIRYMFTMMNRARQAVAMQGVAISDRARQQAVHFARERVQGRDSSGNRVSIIHHADVRRMLLHMRASTEVMRALMLETAATADRARIASNPQHLEAIKAREALLTPIVKGWITELAQEVTSLNVQVHGGMGFIEETGAAQHFRDARILPIYEGTTGIQALDLLGRKVLLDSGAALDNLLGEISACFAEAGEVVPRLAKGFNTSLNAIKEARNWLLEHGGDRAATGPAVSVHLLMGLGYLCGGWMAAKGLIAASGLSDADVENSAWLEGRITSSVFYCEQLLPRALTHATALLAGADSILAFDEELF